MDQIKIGKLIAKLRKEKGMTQRELGDKVGVGFKAVSKWERGITCPDISIINELSKILGITSDELLTGELSKEHQTNHQNNKKLNKKLLLIIPILLIIIISIVAISKNNTSQMEVYNLDSISDEYYVEGKVIFDKDKMAIYINKISFNNKYFNKMIIKNYNCTIESNGNTLIKYGYFLNNEELPIIPTVAEIFQGFVINNETVSNINQKEIIKNNLNIKINFLDTNDDIIEKNITVTLSKSK